MGTFKTLPEGHNDSLSPTRMTVDSVMIFFLMQKVYQQKINGLRKVKKRIRVEM